MAMRETRRIADAISLHTSRQAERASRFGGTKIGQIISLDPFSVQPLGGSVPLVEEDMMWTNLMRVIKDDLAEGDTVVLSLMEDGTYLIQDVVDTGTTIEFVPDVGDDNFTVVQALADYSALITDQVILVNSGGGPITITLPASHTTGQAYHIKDYGGDAEDNNITIATADSDTIDSQATFTLTVNFQSISLVSGIGVWHIL